ncbi:glyoxalase [Pseudomonas alcaligenes]|uniref:Glyoxalase n=1 Tax=Aquipseudomonas alcaligenes TaxID=43263 RepID=A0ABR7S008_AQUAC|nr:VOC family protein [Pseudomonas alcaligenes]MBC9249813.1 glyoxalase [Pseudomonas alcaligenes]
MERGSSLIPCVLYRDAPAAIAWLCQVFGLREHLRVSAGNGLIEHAQLLHEHGMLMLGSLKDGDYGKQMREPRAVGGNTQGIYLVLADPDAAYARAQQAGAEIVIAIKDEEYGGRGFTCRDLEGHLWSLGSYDPWSE